MGFSLTDDPIPTPEAPANETLGDIKRESESGGEVQGSSPGDVASRRRRGRPPGSKNRAKDSAGNQTLAMPEAQALEPIYDAIFGIVASRYGDHWRLHKDETATLAKLSHAVMLKYADSFASKYGAEIVLGGYLAIVIGGRVALQPKKEPEPEDVQPIATIQ